jgi:MinD superfamily P-loop ATPase
MIHARLIPGADTSGKLVSKVKKKASEIAKKSKEWILIDVGSLTNVVKSK